jgi:molybdate transport system ATP-binding protein
MLRAALRVQADSFTLAAQLELPTPGVTALFGPSGAGKTTLAHAIAGLVPADGFIELDGEVLLDTQRGIHVPCERRRIGCVFQDARLFPHLSVLNNLRYGLQRAAGPTYAHWDEVMALLGLDALLQRRPHQLSGGEKQRVALGRALLAQPRLLLLDEPLASIDRARRDDVLPYLELLRDRYQLPMLYVSHQYDEVLRLANFVVLLDGGGVLAHDTLSALSVSPAYRSKLGGAGIGAVIESRVLATDAAHGLMTVDLGGYPLRLHNVGDPVGRAIRLHVLANDVILALDPPAGLSVRNALPATVESLDAEPNGLVLVTIAVGGVRLLSRVTPSAVEELNLQCGCALWALVKAASLTQGLYHPTGRRESRDALRLS